MKTLSLTIAPPTEDGRVKITVLPDYQRRIEQLEDAVRCAADWLRMGAPGLALDVLEANMRL